MSGASMAYPAVRRRISAPNDAIASQAAAMALTPRAFALLSAILHPGLTQATVRRDAAAQTGSGVRVQLRRNRRKTCRRPSKPSSPSASWPSSLLAPSKKSRRPRRSSSPSRSWASTKAFTARLAAPGHAAARGSGPRRIVSAIGFLRRRYPCVALTTALAGWRDRCRSHGPAPFAQDGCPFSPPARGSSLTPSRRNQSPKSMATRCPSAGPPISLSGQPTPPARLPARRSARAESNLAPGSRAPWRFVCRCSGMATVARSQPKGRAQRAPRRWGHQASGPSARAACRCVKSEGRPC